MKLNKIMENITNYLEKGILKNSKEKKLKKIINDLRDKKSDTKEALKKLEKSNLHKKDKLEKRLDAIKKLLRSSKALLKNKK